jgi:hypothetical protein
MWLLVWPGLVVNRSGPVLSPKEGFNKDPSDSTTVEGPARPMKAGFQQSIQQHFEELGAINTLK